jgi:hypothetical protein
VTASELAVAATGSVFATDTADAGGGSEALSAACDEGDTAVELADGEDEGTEAVVEVAGMAEGAGTFAVVGLVEFAGTLVAAADGEFLAEVATESGVIMGEVVATAATAAAAPLDTIACSAPLFPAVATSAGDVAVIGAPLAAEVSLSLEPGVAAAAGGPVTDLPPTLAA